MVKHKETREVCRQAHKNVGDLSMATPFFEHWQVFFIEKLKFLQKKYQNFQKRLQK